MTSKIILGLLVLAVGAGLAYNLMHENNGQAQSIFSLRPDDPELVAAGTVVYAEACAVCHGANLEGQANWRQPLANGRLPAPPHDQTGHTWHHPDIILFRITKYGSAALVGDANYQSDMLGFLNTLSDEEIIAVLSYIKSTWPEDIQRQHDQINQRPRN